MCLKTVTKEKKIDPLEPEIWYKLVDKYKTKKGKVYYTSYCRSKKIELNTVYQDKSKGFITASHFRSAFEKYQKGYHFYNITGARKGIRKYCGNNYYYGTTVILKCLVWNIVCHGKDYYGRACVARKFVALGEVK